MQKNSKYPTNFFKKIREVVHQNFKLLFPLGLGQGEGGACLGGPAARSEGSAGQRLGRAASRRVEPFADATARRLDGDPTPAAGLAVMETSSASSAGPAGALPAPGQTDPLFGTAPGALGCPWRTRDHRVGSAVGGTLIVLGEYSSNRSNFTLCAMIVTWVRGK